MIKRTIEDNAHKILEFLDRFEVSSSFELEKALSIDRRNVLLALGWLANEGKIYFFGREKDSKIAIVYPD